MTDELTAILDDLIEIENTRRQFNRDEAMSRIKERIFAVTKELCFAMTESPEDYEPEKFNVEFFHVRDEVLEAVAPERTTVQALLGALGERMAYERNPQLLYCFKKFHLVKQHLKCRHPTRN
jgi:hypothetical protein